MKKIEIIIDGKGDVSIEGEGFHGPECAKLIGEIQESLGTVTSSHRKREYQERAVAERNRQGGRS